MFLKDLFGLFFRVYEHLPTWMYGYHMHIRCPQKAEESAESPGTALEKAVSHCVGARN